LLSRNAFGLEPQAVAVERERAGARGRAGQARSRGRETGESRRLPDLRRDVDRRDGAAPGCLTCNREPELAFRQCLAAPSLADVEAGRGSRSGAFGWLKPCLTAQVSERHGLAFSPRATNPRRRQAAARPYR
jgi:hypothetical protein